MPSPLPEIASAIVPLIDGIRRALIKLPGKGLKDFPNVGVCLEIEGNPGDATAYFLQDPWKFTSNRARQEVERAANLHPNDMASILAAARDWAAAAQRQIETSLQTPPEQPPMPYGVLQRVMTQASNEAQRYAIGTPHEFLSLLLNQRNLRDDTVLEWEKKQVDRLVILDLDFHNKDAPKPSATEIDELGYALSPAPWAWWRTQGGGLHAVYAQSPNSTFTAMELGSGAAAQLLTNPLIVRCKGAVELVPRTRHPVARQKNETCGPIHQSSPDENFECLASFSQAGATEEEINDVIEASGVALGQRLDHSMCLIEPQHTSTSPNPVVIMPNGVFCHSCMARTGRGWTSWAEVRRIHGLSSSLPNQAQPIMDAVLNFVQFCHAEYLFGALADEIPAVYRAPLYSALLKRQHGADPRAAMAMQEFGFVRGFGCWLHEDSLTPAKPLNKDDVSVLPSVCAINEEGEVKPVLNKLTKHSNTGNIAGWNVLSPNPFVPLYSQHNIPVSELGEILCRPKKTNVVRLDRVRYLPFDKRLSLADTEAQFTAYFPGVSMQYVRAIVAAMGCAESGHGKVPILWATGPSGAAKTTTLRIVQEMFGERYQNLSGIQSDQRDEMFGQSLETTRAIMFDDFAKEPKEYRSFHTFILRISRQHTYRHIYVGMRTLPIRSAVILTDWKKPEFFATNVQFGRRVHIVHLDKVEDWEKLGHFVENWWQKSKELRAIAESLYSHLVDELFPDGDDGDFPTKMEKLGISTLIREARSSDEELDPLAYLVRRLANSICAAKPMSAEDQRRLGQGMCEVQWSTANPIGNACRQLVESLGNVEMTEENLRHVLEPYNSELHRYLPLTMPAEFQTRENGQHTYIRIVERGTVARTKRKTINGDLFLSLPIEEDPLFVPDVPSIPQLPGMIPTAAPTAPGTRFFFHPESDSYVTVPAEDIEAFGHSTEAGLCTEIEESEYNEAMGLVPDDVRTPTDVAQAAIDAFAIKHLATDAAPTLPGYRTIFLDYETQSACDLKKYGSYVYAQHPTTIVICAAIRIDVHRIFWTDKPYNITVPPGVHYIVGRQELIDMMEGAPVALVVHNMNFERPISLYTLGLPEPAMWVDTADVTLTRGLPAGADQAGEYLLGMGKDIDGYKLMMKTCKPNKKGEMPVITDAIVQRYVGYNFRDTDISVGIAQRFGMLAEPAWEQEIVELHQAVNHFGIRIDRQFAETLRSFDEVFKAQAGAHVELITNGEVTRADLNRNDFLRTWFKSKGLELDNMRADNLEKLIDAYEEGDAPEIPPYLIDVIKNRMVVTRAAMSKVDTALRCAADDGRMHAQFRYAGAHTGRWSGYQFQPQNLKRPDEDSFDLKSAIEAVERADLAQFRMLCRHRKSGKVLPPYELLSSLVRGLIVPEPGSVLIVGDFPQIEARKLLWLCEDWENMQEHIDFDAGRGPDVYCTLASTVYGKLITKKDNPNERQAGKIGQLACLAEGTPVLTQRGWKPIETVTTEDTLWDGTAWVAHEGLVDRGEKECIEIDGVRMTRDHLVLTVDGWEEAGCLHPQQRFQGNTSADGRCWLTDHRENDTAAACVGQKAMSLRGLSPKGHRQVATPARSYDLANAGPNHRFQAGALIVHNCGFGGAEGAINRFAYGMDIDLESAGVTATQIKEAWRMKHPRAVRMWKDYEWSMRKALQFPGKAVSAHRCMFQKLDGNLYITLPSGRKLHYMNCRLEASQKRGYEDSLAIVYDSATKGKVIRHETYGGKITENIVQASSSDLLRFALLRIAKETGLPIPLHVHDEAVTESPEERSDNDRVVISQIMSEPPAWAQGMPMDVDADIMLRYGK